MSAVVRSIRRTPGEMGDLTYDVDIETPDGAEHHVVFRGNIFVGPVVLTVTDAGGNRAIVVEEPRRFGEFATEDWIHRFVGHCQEQGDPPPR